MIGMLDHQMHVERQLRQFAHRPDYRRAKGNIVDEMAIHDVEMKPVGPGFFDAADFVGELGEVRGKDGRSDQDFRHGVMD
jgi:hypothetical protein